LFEGTFLERAEEAAFELLKVAAVDVVTVHHVDVATDHDLPAGELGDATGDAQLELNEGENVHERGFVGIVGTEADVHAEDWLAVLLEMRHQMLCMQAGS